ncbi:MAG TPA: outer membrane protein assembly factor BamD [Dinghuibacter sp.]|jgi:outer membrane protein assembly factor BamD|uniref:outer membrane protein assembly factor BamD n=1 Tax=Dinghuibacter sp. TaxID=2024697 RepID=UPI002B94E50F|nr:outer membrane protein assembly factor BamD [Dinghuibacter sp.]HTJ13809.1 outer membrane protein assembly factor BamD [Dinghuibacter sp.]
MMKRIGLLLMVPVLLTLGGCSPFSRVQKSNDYSYKLRMAEQYFVKKKYNFAQQLFEELLPIYKGTEEAENMLYKYAYCAYYLEDYLSAEGIFKQFIESYPKSEMVEEVDFMRAYCYYKQSPKVELDQSNTEKAMGAMQAFINMHPTSPRVKEAGNIIDICRQKLEDKEEQAAQLYFNIGYFRAAAITFAQVLEDYPDSKKGDFYKLMVVRSDYEFAKISVEWKQKERYETVETEYRDMVDRFPESKLLPEAKHFNILSENLIKELLNEQAKEAAGG